MRRTRSWLIIWPTNHTVSVVTYWFACDWSLVKPRIKLDGSPFSSHPKYISYQPSLFRCNRHASTALNMAGKPRHLIVSFTFSTFFLRFFIIFILACIYMYLKFIALASRPTAAHCIRTMARSFLSFIALALIGLAS